jgi:hypothetical protein
LGDGSPEKHRRDLVLISDLVSDDIVFPYVVIDEKTVREPGFFVLAFCMDSARLLERDPPNRCPSIPSEGRVSIDPVQSLLPRQYFHARIKIRLATDQVLVKNPAAPTLT